MCPARVPEDAARGSIIAIGGAEDRIRDTDILRRFVKLAGRDQAHVVIIPTASELSETGRSYEALFKKLGVATASVLQIQSRADCEQDAALTTLGAATGVFLTGGNQLRLSTTLGGTSVARLLRRLNAAGVPVAGTSAGAAFLSEHMIAFGDEGPTPRAGMVTLAPGLGLSNRVVVDQHFRQRDRLGRLLTALAYNPFAIGVGLDEDTAAFISSGDILDVHGSGAITIVDPSGVEFSSIDSAVAQEPVCLIGVKLHVLVEGSSFDLSTRKAVPSRAQARR